MSASSSVAPAANAGDCSVVRFSTDDYAPHERLTAVHEILGRNLQKVHVEPASKEAFNTTITLRQMSGLTLYTGSRSAAIFRRSRELIEHDDVIVIFGFSRYEVGHLGRTLTMGAGESVILTGAEPAFFGGSDQTSVTLLRVPMHVLTPFVADLEGAYGRPIPADNAALRLLTGYVGLLEEADAFAASELRRQTVTHIHDLIALAIGATRDAAEIANSRGAQGARLCAIKQDIAHALDQPDLSVVTIATRHRINPRWVQRLFEGEGTTFTEYVLAQRLARAHHLLTDPGYARLKISAIAFDAGFGDLSYFNRVFRRRYGVTPSELRAAATAGD